jgi:hypothetical protein
MNNSAGVLGVARPHSRDGLAFAGIARAHLAHGGCDLYVRHSKISQGADWISIASGSERPLANALVASIPHEILFRFFICANNDCEASNRRIPPTSAASKYYKFCNKMELEERI